MKQITLIHNERTNQFLIVFDETRGDRRKIRTMSVDPALETQLLPVVVEGFRLVDEAFMHDENRYRLSPK